MRGWPHRSCGFDALLARAYLRAPDRPGDIAFRLRKAAALALVCERQPEQSFARRELPLVERRLDRATVDAIEAEARIWLEGGRS